jgi:hypothetical protein
VLSICWLHVEARGKLRPRSDRYGPG